LTPSTLTISTGIALATGTATAPVTKVGTGTLSLTGSTPNVYNGQTSVNGGTLLLAKDKRVLALPGNLVVGNATQPPSSDLVQLQSPNQLPPSAAVTINSDGLFDLNGNTQAVATLSMTGGTISLTGSGAVLSVTGSATGTGDAAGNPA